MNYILRDENGNLNYLCTDLSRKIFKFKNKIGQLEKDVNAQKLTNLLTENGILKVTTKFNKITGRMKMVQLITKSYQ
jgi:hypothetical protein